MGGRGEAITERPDKQGGGENLLDHLLLKQEGKKPNPPVQKSG